MAKTNQQPEEHTPPLRVLIADDVQETRRSTRLMLATIPTVEVVATARDGRQAVDLTKKHKPDIAIMDVRMPEMDGLTAIRAMLDVHPQMVCIVMSTERDSQTLRDAMSVGARAYLIKPYTLEELGQVIQQAGEVVRSLQQRTIEAEQLRSQRDAYLKQLAQEYTNTKRTDDQAIEVFEELASNPECELRWMRTLAMIYVIRQEWDKLVPLAQRLQHRAST
ncbi:MAG: response regulator [Chloroflexota bacterium]